MRTNRATTTVSLAAVSLALVLAGCSSAEEDPTVEDATATSDAGSGTASDDADDDSASDDASASGDADDDTASDGASGSDSASDGADDASDGASGSDGAELPGVAELASAIAAAQELVPEGDVVMLERDDSGFEVDVVDGTTLVEITLRPDLSVAEQESDDVDDDTLAELEAAELTMIDAITAAAVEGAISDDPVVEEIELDTEDGTVRWEFDLDGDDEGDVYVDAVTGEVTTE